MEIDKRVFSEQLQRLLRERGISKYKLAKDIGCSQSSISNWIEMKSVPTASSIRAISEYFDVDVGTLIGSDQFILFRKKSPEPPKIEEMDDFTYAMHGFSGDLTEENKQALRQMAQQLADANRKKNVNGASK